MEGSLIIDLLGSDISSEEKEILQHPNVSGVILFERNIIPYQRQDLLRLTETIHSIRPDIFIMTDHEGGHVQRFRRMGFRPLMSAGSLGRAYKLHPEVGLALAYQEGQSMAQDLLNCGIDLSLAPVLDLSTNESDIIGGLDRAFHEEPHHIAQLAQSYIEGMHDMHMPSVGKHFPGHGSCKADSHRALPILEKTREKLNQSDLKPFIDLIHQNLLDAVMPAHVLYPEVDAKHATTYSSIWLKTILREELCFDGLVMSDCLGMKGADIGNLTTRAQQALEAGCDLLIVANQSRATLKNLLDSLPTQNKNQRIEKFKSKMARFNGQLKPTIKAHTIQDITLSDPHNPTTTV